MLKYTGHPFVDIGIATITAQVEKRQPEDVTADDLARVVEYIEQNYVRAPLRGHLTMAFTSNAWFIQDAFNPDKPELSPEKRAERRATRDRWAAHHLRQWEHNETSGEVCLFTGLPAAPREVSGKLAPGRLGRNQMPLLQGDDAINFFTGGDPGLPVSPLALLALQFMPMGCAKCGVGLLAVHSSSEALTRAFARRFFEQNIAAVLQAQATGKDKLPTAQRSLKTLLIEELTAIEEQRLKEERRSERAASITAYNFNNGKSPQLAIYHLPLQISSFLRIALTATYRDTWQQIVQRGWQREQVKTDRKGNITERITPKYNYLYEDLFTLPQGASRFIRRYFLRVPQRTRFDDDPRSTYSPAREQKLISWSLVELFLKEVMTMDEDRIAHIRLLGDKLADYTRNQGGRRFFRAFFTEQNTSSFISLRRTLMAFVTGLALIDAPASALNNLGSIPGEREDNTVGVKIIKTKEGSYPYVSAQAFRYWLRETLSSRVGEWHAAPIYREEKVAYTDANPLLYLDGDVFGYIRAPSKKETAKLARAADASRAGETETTGTITRAAPFRVSTLVSVAPITPTSDFGTMSRHEGNPVPHEHQFYRTTLKGLFSLDLHACGTFSYRNKTGFRNLDSVREALAKDVEGIEHLEAEKAYRLPRHQRVERIKALFEGMAQIEGGAKQTLHYTDVSPALVMLAVTKGGNHIFHHAVGANQKGQPTIKLNALREALDVYADTILSPVYIGWAQGYLDEERASVEAFARDYVGREITISHPRSAFQALIAGFDANPGWMASEGDPSSVWGRPVDVLVAPDGALLVSDGGGAIYRITYGAT